MATQVSQFSGYKQGANRPENLQYCFLTSRSYVRVGVGAAAVGTCIIVGGGSLSDGTGDEWCLWRGCAVLSIDDCSPNHWRWHCRAGQPISNHGDAPLEPLSAFSTWRNPADVRGVHEWSRKKGQREKSLAAYLEVE